ncbi:hypothetical protein M431DRAFT_325101 [Trichoderma harzianum CBS 226.95]|uniref:Uncharacterized protein n=1 Tax=Trichoderma harzianum CBS 226.95 TaxID=983964 RepID=A0A2T3ZUQ4_TRIHA|nr:hypothetical protein M431DRAFT_325101 [Trichoderma harzianum CBS 226.95]PTB48528.1 hypothetical protein M431DRAFT_325101 [Trichoderma harzianum CBS 226.95]
MAHLHGHLGAWSVRFINSRILSEPLLVFLALALYPSFTPGYAGPLLGGREPFWLASSRVQHTNPCASKKAAVGTRLNRPI